MAEADDILRCLWRSEHDYAEIRERRDALAALPSRTADQDRILADYQSKLDHDDAVVSQWVQRLATIQGRTPLQVRTALRQNAALIAARAAALQQQESEEDAVAVEQRAQRDAENATEESDVREIRERLIRAAIDGTLSDSELFQAIQDRRGRGAELEQRAAKRDARRARMAAARARPCEWGAG